MYAQLMTAVNCDSKGYTIDDTSCRVCNYFSEYENLRHLLLDCKAPQIVDARRKVILDFCNVVKQYGFASSAACFQRMLVLDNFSICFHSANNAPPDEDYERTFLFLTGRWDNELIQFMTSLVKDEHVAIFFRSIGFSLRLYWRLVWKIWRIAALPYGT